MFPGTYFAPHYFAKVYFPGSFAAKVRYFPHRYFAQRYFPDRYFPGNLSTGVVEPPIEPPVQEFVGVGGLPVRELRIPLIHALADLVLPALEFQAFGYTTPASIHVRTDLHLPALRMGLQWQARPAPVVHALLVLDDLVFSGTLHQRPPRKRLVEDEDEQVLLEHYMLTTHRGK